MDNHANSEWIEWTESIIHLNACFCNSFFSVNCTQGIFPWFPFIINTAVFTHYFAGQNPVQNGRKPFEYILTMCFLSINCTSVFFFFFFFAISIFINITYDFTHYFLRFIVLPSQNGKKQFCWWIFRDSSYPFIIFSLNHAYEGGSKSPCNHLFSLHMGAFIQRWQCLHQVQTFVFHTM